MICSLSPSFPWKLWLPRSIYCYPSLRARSECTLYASAPVEGVLAGVPYRTWTVHLVFCSRRGTWHVRHITVVEGPNPDEPVVGLHPPDSALHETEGDEIEWVDGRSLGSLRLEGAAPYRWRAVRSPEGGVRAPAGHVVCSVPRVLRGTRLVTGDGRIERESWTPGADEHVHPPTRVEAA